MYKAILAGAAAALTIATAAHGAALRVTPVGLDLTAPTSTGAISLTNEGAQPVTLQVRVFHWTATNGEEQLEPTEAVIASPPVATIKAGETYTIRVMRISGAAPVSEESYRLLVDEIPTIAPGSPNGVRMVLRTSIPVFFGPDGAASKLSFSARLAGQQVELTAANNGNRHVRMASAKLNGLSKPVSFGDGLNGYILAGSTLKLSAPAAGTTAVGPVTLTANTDTGPITVPVTLASP